jgi:hypothetical protein
MPHAANRLHAMPARRISDFSLREAGRFFVARAFFFFSFFLLFRLSDQKTAGFACSGFPGK